MTSPGTDPADRPDEDLRERLHRADPLAGRDPRLDPSSLEVLMSELTRPAPDSAASPGAAAAGDGTDHGGDGTDHGASGPDAPRRRPAWAVPATAAAAAAAVAVAVSLSGVLAGDPAPTPPVAQRPGLTVSVPVTDPVSSMCIQLSPELLAPAQYAFDGVVTALDGGTATLTPSRWYAGERAGTVAVTVPPEVQTALVGAPSFELGKRYLVAGGDGQVGLCGMSDAYSPELEALYRAAFSG